MPTRREDDASAGRAVDTVELLPDVPGAGGDLLENRAEPSAWERRWGSLPPAWRRRLSAGTAVAVAVAALLAGGDQAREWLAERAERQRVSLTTTVGVWTSSSTPPGGQVTYFLEVSNGGSLPLEVTSVQASAPGLALEARNDAPRQVAAGDLVLIPLSVLLTCPTSPSGAETGDRVRVSVTRADGGRTEENLPLQRFALVSDASRTLCSVRPGLRGYELSGPVVRPAAAEVG